MLYHQKLGILHLLGALILVGSCFSYYAHESAAIVTIGVVIGISLNILGAVLYDRWNRSMDPRHTRNIDSHMSPIVDAYGVFIKISRNNRFILEF